MQFTLSDEESSTLRNLLRDHLPELRRETAATDLPARELRIELHKRVALSERLLAELNQQLDTGGGPSR